MGDQPEDSWEVGEVRFLGLRPRRAILAGIALVLALTAAVLLIVVFAQLIIGLVAAAVLAVLAGLLVAGMGAPLFGWFGYWSSDPARSTERQPRK